MRRFVLLLLLVSLSLPVFAQDANVQITFPEAVSSVQGTVNITGTVNPPDLQSYFFEVADASADPNTVVWTPVTLPSRTAVTGGTPAARVGGPVELIGLGTLFDGRYAVTRVRHRFDLQRGLRTYLDVERPGIGG